MTNPYYEQLEAAGHVLQLNEDGEIDAIGWSVEGHNGPRCIICDGYWCEHCAREPDPCDGGAHKRAYEARKRLEAAAPALLDELRGVERWLVAVISVSSDSSVRIGGRKAVRDIQKAIALATEGGAVVSFGTGKTPPFEVGNAVWAEGRLSTVSRVYANGNFRIAGIDGQWRQGGYRAGSATGRAEHYTTEVANREALNRARGRLRLALSNVGDARNKIAHLDLEAAERLTEQAQAILKELGVAR